MRTILLYSIALALLGLACTEVPNDGEASYIAFQNVNLVTENTTQGANSSDILDISVQVGDQLMGTYEWPLVLPVFASGEQTMLVDAGIPLNGDYFLREIYPFYAQLDTTITLVPFDTTFVDLTFRYGDNAQFAFIENFEAGNAFDDMQTDSVTLWGDEAGKLSPPLGGTLLSSTTGSFPIPTGTPAFLEVDYLLQDAVLDVYITGVEGGSVVETFRIARLGSSDEWQKIYLEVNNEVGNLNTSGYRIELVAGGASEGSPTVRLDNIKIVHF